MTATMVPRTRAPIAEMMHSWKVSQNPSRKLPRLSMSVSTPSHPPARTDSKGIRTDPNGSVPVHRRRGRQVRVELARGVLPRLLVPAVLERLLQDVVDPVTELGV